MFVRILITVAILLCVTLSAYYFFHPHSGKEDIELTFSGTQEWNPDFLKAAVELDEFTTQGLAHITLLPPPSNNSSETQSELQAMHELVTERTPEKLLEIQDELSVQTSVYGTTTLETFINPQLRPYTSDLMDLITELSGAFIFAQKLKFDRVRPSLLDPTLSTAIPVPGHPAYPSGHATQSHLIALVLGKLDPEHKELYLQSANRIARNREIAGVHYRSDSDAGKQLAKQLLPILFEHPAFLELFQQAQTEW